jgi:ABC-type amino acid transport substrate-binding protein
MKQQSMERIHSVLHLGAALIALIAAGVTLAAPWASPQPKPRHRRTGFGIALISALMVAVAPPSLTWAQTLERARETGVVRLGHRHDARPFSFVGPDGTPAGYTIELCKKVVAAIGESVGRELTPEYVEVSTEDRFQAVAEGRVDLLCGADTVTLGRRETVSFTIPVYLTGISAVLSANAPRLLNEVIAGQAGGLRRVRRSCRRSGTRPSAYGRERRRRRGSKDTSPGSAGPPRWLR